MHVRRDSLDEQGRYVDQNAYQLIARLHADNYVVADQQFELKALRLEDHFMTGTPIRVLIINPNATEVMMARPP